jgi:hypothetical protein
VILTTAFEEKVSHHPEFKLESVMRIEEVAIDSELAADLPVSALITQHH